MAEDSRLLATRVPTAACRPTRVAPMPQKLRVEFLCRGQGQGQGGLVGGVLWGAPR